MKHDNSDYRYRISIRSRWSFSSFRQYILPWFKDNEISWDWANFDHHDFDTACLLIYDNPGYCLMFKKKEDEAAFRLTFFEMCDC